MPLPITPAPSTATHGSGVSCADHSAVGFVTEMAGKLKTRGRMLGRAPITINVPRSTKPETIEATFAVSTYHLERDRAGGAR